jgi:hypothetical protein
VTLTCRRRRRHRRGRAGTIDATFRAVTKTAQQLPAGDQVARVLDDPHPAAHRAPHELAAPAPSRPPQLAGHRIWMPGAVPGTEWAAFYDELAAAFGLTIDTGGPNFGTEACWLRSPARPDLATFVGEQAAVIWPDTTTCGASPVRDPAPVYPHSLIWRATTRTPPSPRFATTSAPPSPATAAPAPGPRNGRSVRRPNRRAR